MIAAKHILLVICSYCVFVFIIFSSCSNNTQQESIDQSIANGKALATQYCQSCHLLPDPSLLDKKTWANGALPGMGPYFGIFNYGMQSYPSRKNDRDVDRNYYPSSPIIGYQQWQDIINYYTTTAPDSLPKQKRELKIKMSLPSFKPELIFLQGSLPATGMINIDNTSHTFYISNITKNKMYRFNKKFVAIDSVKTPGPVVSMAFEKNKLVVCNIGILNPNDGKHGSVSYININEKGKMIASDHLLFDNLKRPVGITKADLNNDGKDDYLVCEFGNTAGSLSWLENKGEDKFARNVLRNDPGAITAYVDDYNHDGLPDIWALFAQADESIVLFTNKGNGNFDQQQVLRFPSVYGSSSFELIDFNKDGYPDILYTCGDNADYSAILKPYHGVYLFLNDGKNHFTQKYFFPINGCYKAIAKDFDGDGDLDIATISFFADYENQPEESFVYLENLGNYNFQPYSFPEAKLGRWLTMDAGDIDGDGKPDIILGNFSVRGLNTHSLVDWKKGPAFIVLKNVGKNN